MWVNLRWKSVDPTYFLVYNETEQKEISFITFLEVKDVFIIPLAPLAHVDEWVFFPSTSSDIRFNCKEMQIMKRREMKQ